MGDVANPYAIVKIKSKNGSNYNDTAYSVTSGNIEGFENNVSKNVTLNFSDLAAGNYIIVFEVYGYGDVLYSTSAIPIEVK